MKYLLPILFALLLSACQTDNPTPEPTVPSWTQTYEGHKLKTQPTTLQMHSDGSFGIWRVIRYVSRPGTDKMEPHYDFNLQGTWEKSGDGRYRFTLEDGRKFQCEPGKNPIPGMQIPEMRVTVTNFDAISGIRFLPIKRVSSL